MSARVAERHAGSLSSSALSFRGLAWTPLAAEALGAIDDETSQNLHTFDP